jgi:hypothetical protein
VLDHNRARPDGAGTTLASETGAASDAPSTKSDQ